MVASTRFTRAKCSEQAANLPRVFLEYYWYDEAITWSALSQGSCKALQWNSWWWLRADQISDSHQIHQPHLRLHLSRCLLHGESIIKSVRESYWLPLEKTEESLTLPEGNAAWGLRWEINSYQETWGTKESNQSEKQKGRESERWWKERDGK